MATKAPKKLDALDALAQGDPKMVMALMLWKARLREPDMYVQITEDDIKGFDDCVKYLKVKPDVLVRRPQGVPAQGAVPAQGNRRAVPARAAIPPRPYVMVSLVEAGTENMIRPVENNEADFDAQQAAAQVRKARDQAPDLAQRLVKAAASGDYSLSDMQDAANALLTLARTG